MRPIEYPGAMRKPADRRPAWRPRSRLCGEVGARLRALRLELGFSQVYAAEKAGVDATYLVQIEQGKANLTLETIEAFARAYGARARLVIE